jgi:hypothetical protein
MRETNQRRTWPWVLGDLAVIAAIVLFAVLALALRDSVARLADMATGIRDTGTAIQTSGQATAGEIRTNVGQAAESLANVPFIGQDLRSRVQRTGDRTADAVERESGMNGARLVATGRQGQRDVLETARLVGWLAFLVPSVLLLAIWLPRRLLTRRRHEAPQRAEVPQRRPRRAPVSSGASGRD